MKITYVAHSILNRGGDKMVLAHAAWLAEQGYEVELCCNIVDTVLNIPERANLTRPYFSGIFGTIVSALFQRRDADIVLASIIPMACFLYPRSRKKVVFFAQDFNESFYTSSVLRGMIRLFNYVGLNIFRIPVIAVSNRLADSFKRRFQAKVNVAENGVMTEVFYPDPDPDLIAVKGDSKALLIFSRNDLGKGFNIAQCVVRRLSVLTPKLFEVWTVGENCKGAFDGIVHRDFGYVREDKLRQIMSSADTFLYPTLHEGFGLMPLEAFACRCPVVTTNVVEFATHLENALVAPVGDIEQLTKLTYHMLLSGSADVELMAASGFQTAERMSLKRTLVLFEAILESIVSGENL